jgi:hypothetical protein
MCPLTIDELDDTPRVAAEICSVVQIVEQSLNIKFENKENKMSGKRLNFHVSTKSWLAGLCLFRYPLLCPS